MMKLRFPKLTAVPAILAASALALPLTASADAIVRLGGAMIQPDEDSLSISPGASLEIDDDTVVSGDFTWLFTEHFGIELWTHDSFDMGVNYKNAPIDRPVGAIEAWLPSATLQWHPFRDSWFRPYVGAGVAYQELDVSPDQFDVDEEMGWTAGGGIDMGKPYHGFFVNVFAKYFSFEPKAELKRTGPVPVPPIVGGGNLELGELELNPWVFGASVGYRFGKEPAAPVVAAAPPPPKPAPAPAKCPDEDNDGVCDASDACPGTPAGTRVGPAGCDCDFVMRLAFAFDSDELTADDKAQLDQLAVRLNDPRLSFVAGEIVGHTDSIGDDAYNMDLSKRRAHAVTEYLRGKGIKLADRFEATGMGETKPLADNSTEEGRAQNRRVTIRRQDCGPG
jgi:outer membrane protein OmpA-like peptidoglycan-associated protein